MRDIACLSYFTRRTIQILISVPLGSGKESIEIGQGLCL